MLSPRIFQGIGVIAFEFRDRIFASLRWDKNDR